MIKYDNSEWSFGLVCKIRGSVVPRAMVLALPNTLIAVLIHWYLHEDDLHDEIRYDSTVSMVWWAFNFLISFLLTFRTEKAYGRWWEGGSLLQQARGEWFNAYSSLVAFASMKQEKEQEVEDFRMVLATLISMLYCSALQQISQMESTTFEVLELKAFDQESLSYLRSSMDRTAVIVHWIQRLIVENHRTEVIDIDSPLLTRVFQELSRGMVKVNDVRKIFEFLFPFPYAQMITVLLLLHFCFTPVICGLTLSSPYWSGAVAFISVFALWSLNFVAAELENPFGDDANDLPMHGMMRHMNQTVLLLLNPRAHIIPNATDIEYDPLDPVEFGKKDPNNLIAPTQGVLHRRCSNAANAMNATATGNNCFTGFEDIIRQKKRKETKSSLKLAVRFASLTQGAPGKRGSIESSKNAQDDELAEVVGINSNGTLLIKNGGVVEGVRAASPSRANARKGTPKALEALESEEQSQSRAMSPDESGATPADMTGRTPKALQGTRDVDGGGLLLDALEPGFFQCVTEVATPREPYRVGRCHTTPRGSR